MKFKRNSLLLISALYIILALVSAFAHEEKMEMEMDEGEAARAKIEEYIKERDTNRAEDISGEILDHQALELDQILIQLRRWKRYDEEKTGAFLDQKISIDSNEIKYALYVPKTYNPQVESPLLVCLHGAGFDGNRSLERWISRLGESYIILCPSVEGGIWWTNDVALQVISLIKEIKSRYNIDTNRIYLTGMSNGGVGAMRIGINFSDIFAAVIPMAGAMPDEALPLLKNLKNTPVYLIHGSKDQVMPVEYSRKINSRLIELGYDAVYREHDRVHPQAGGHFFPAEELPELIRWMGERKRNPYPKEVVMLTSGGEGNSHYWIRIDGLENKKEGKRNWRLFAEIKAEVVDNNRIEVTSDKVKRYTLFLNDKIVDLSKPVAIVTNGKISFEGMVKKDPSILLREARSRLDKEMLFTAAVSIKID